MRATPADQVLTAAASALARRQLKTARSLMDTALAAPPPDAPIGELLSMRGVIRVEQRDIAGACQDYHQAIQWYDARDEDTNPRLAQVLGLLATEIVESDPAQARAYLERAVAIYDTNETAVAGHQTWRESRIADVARLGMLAEQDADFGSARAYYDRALELCAAARGSTAGRCDSRAPDGRGHHPAESTNTRPRTTCDSADAAAAAKPTERDNSMWTRSACFKP